MPAGGGQATLTASYAGTAEFRGQLRHRITHREPRERTSERDRRRLHRYGGSSSLEVEPRGVLGNDSDPDGGPLQALADTPPAHGQLQLAADGGFRYTPAPDFAGEDGFTYRASDGSLSSGPVAVRLTVAPVNDPPSFTAGPDQSVSANAGPQVLSGWATDISAGPADESGQQVSFEVDVTLGDVLFSERPAVAPDGTLSFTPSGLPGTAIVTVVAHDDGGRSGAGNDTSSARTFIILVTPL